jgi:hypothetical protein
VTLLTLVFLILTKHFVVDFLLQPPFMWMNKGNLRHPGGYVHAGLHALVTGAIFFLFFLGDMTLGEFFGMSSHVEGLVQGIFLLIATVMVFEFVCHYLIDFAKVNLNARFKWKPDTSENFWYLMGLDQYLHYLTYFAVFYALQQLVQGS